MNESLLDRIPRLERRVRFWRNTSLVLAAILLSGLATGPFFFSVERQHVLRARDAAMMEAVARQQEALARQQAADVARIEAERALQEAKKRKMD
jgi:hypothetical protein